MQPRDSSVRCAIVERSAEWSAECAKAQPPGGQWPLVNAENAAPSSIAAMTMGTGSGGSSDFSIAGAMIFEPVSRRMRESDDW